MPEVMEVGARLEACFCSEMCCGGSPVGNGETRCESCVKSAKADRQHVFVVAVYDCGQRYGGREEGGWWYDCGSLVRQLKLFRGNRQQAYAYCRRLNQRLDSRQFGPNAGKREYTSVLSDGEYRGMVFEDVAPQGFPASRPRYE